MPVSEPAVRALALGAAAVIAAGVGAGVATAGSAVSTGTPLTGPDPGAAGTPPRPAQVAVSLDRPLNAFSPQLALGGGLDGHERGETAQIYTPANQRAMASAGLGALSYRLRTELGMTAWHYAPGGAFSDRAGARGYWTGPDRPRTTPRVSWGYDLPRRGSSADQAADSGYSRLADGSLATLWKSNPYLDAHFTHEPDARHPQWIVVDLGQHRPVDALQLDWYQPYATLFSVQRFVGPSAVLLPGHSPGHWTDFPRGRFAGRPGRQLVQLARRPLVVRFVRVLMRASSHTAPAGSRDVRDRLGFAVREIALGTATRGRLHDLVRHAPSGTAQTHVYVSSTDPWHRAGPADPRYEQPSFQTVMASGLSRGRPVLVPVPILYGTPESAVAELRYLRALGVPVRGVELGEEPDGQLMQPEDYGALYVQFARAIHRAFPGLPVGGPGFQTAIPDWLAWPDAHGDRSWVHRFLAYLRAHRAIDQLGFFSFEWYPFDNTCRNAGPQLAGVSQTLTDVLARQRAHGLPAGLPIYVTEYGYSAYAGQAVTDLSGALLDADTVARFLSLGGTAAYLYGMEPGALMSELAGCRSWGNLTLFLADDSHRGRAPVAAYWAIRMLTRDWAGTGAGQDQLFAASSSARDAAGHELVRAYPLRRPDGTLAVLLLNVDPAHAYDVSLRLGAGAASRALPGPWHQVQLSGAQYVWHPAGAHGHASPDAPPAQGTLAAGAPARLPPYSITVLSGPAPVR